MYRAVITFPTKRVYEIEDFEGITTRFAGESGGYQVSTGRGTDKRTGKRLGMLVYEFTEKTEAEDFLEEVKRRDPNVTGYVRQSQEPKE